MFERILTENGLSHKEAALYLSILEGGELPLSKAAEKSKLKRSTVYSLIEELKKKGIVSTVKKHGITYVSALSPRLLVEHFQHSAELAKSILPQLMDMAYTSPIKPRIRFSEGMQSIKDILFEASSSKEDYIGFIDYTLMPKEIYHYIRTNVAPRRAKMGTKVRLLMPRNERNIQVQKEYKQNIEHKIVDFPSRKNHIEILLYDESKIGCMSYVKNEMFGVVIDSKAIYETLHDLFMLIWQQSGAK